MTAITLRTFEGARHCWWREMTIYRHTAKWTALPEVFDMLFWLVAMGLGLGAQSGSFGPGISYIDYIAPGTLASAVMWSACFGTTFNLTSKFDLTRTYEGIMATPVGVADIALGEIMWGTTHASVTGCLFFVISAAAMLYKSAWALLMPLAIILVGANFAAMGVLAGAYVRKLIYWGSYFAFVITPMFLLSGVFFPVAALPAWIRPLAWIMPLYHGIEVMRALSFGQFSVRILVHLAFLIVIPVVLFIPTVKLFKKRLFV